MLGHTSGYAATSISVAAYALSHGAPLPGCHLPSPVPIRPQAHSGPHAWCQPPRLGLHGQPPASELLRPRLSTSEIYHEGATRRTTCAITCEPLVAGVLACLARSAKTCGQPCQRLAPLLIGQASSFVVSHFLPLLTLPRNH
jgi:hypothetical protein